MNKNQKIEFVEQIKEIIKNSTAIYMVDYHGITVEDINKLRGEFRKDGVTYKVFKNTLMKRAFDEIGGYEKFNDILVGMTGVAFAGENFVAPAKIIEKFSKDKNTMKFKGAYLDGQFFDASKLEMLASMPTKEEVMASIVGSIASPAQGIVGAINGVARDLVNVIDQIAKQKAA
ncbi:MAG: 50S ribosomal protein L10 [Melioribacteraceae bacterium]|nr:50S ribosomal protein L10 [Ignavibacteriota bacterium]MBZ0183869.1 50S ribosomal protein L10 [Melioribacteraceae bacterium]